MMQLFIVGCVIHPDCDYFHFSLIYGIHPIKHNCQMRINGSILDDNMLRYTNPERRKVPQTPDAPLNDLVGHLLRFVYRNGKNANRSIP